MSSMEPFSLIQGNILDSRRMSVHNATSSKLPLTERGILNKSNLVLEVYKLYFGIKVFPMIFYII